MARTVAEDRARILDDIAAAIDQVALAVACLGDAFEQLAVGTADRLEIELFRPAQRAYARGRRAHAGFAERSGMPRSGFTAAAPGSASRGARALVEQAVAAASEADRLLAELQDSLLPLESGDAELRADLSDLRALLGDLPPRSRDLLRTLGR